MGKNKSHSKLVDLTSVKMMKQDREKEAKKGQETRESQVNVAAERVSSTDLLSTAK